MSAAAKATSAALSAASQLTLHLLPALVDQVLDSRKEKSIPRDHYAVGRAAEKLYEYQCKLERAKKKAAVRKYTGKVLKYTAIYRSLTEV